ncbi:helix-turn-helix domain-containing protein [Polymorphospora sp. NPDC051019]|uniref:helix-turn-helix domain-containing protein n=1 Tax=Polymorphospora sp. NPDC051019 TaxID=3155725 RepID=UPI00343F3EC8
MLLAGAEDAKIRVKVVQALGQLRNSLKISQRQVATLMGTQQSAVSDLEKGITDPRLSTIQRFARSIGWRVNIEIVEDLDDPETTAARSLVYYSSWRHTDAPTEQSNLHVGETSSADHPWRRVLESIESAPSSAQDLKRSLGEPEPSGHVGWFGRGEVPRGNLQPTGSRAGG